MDLADKHVLVVGGAGFIGSHLADTLADTRLTVLDDLSTGTHANIAHLQGRDGFRFVEGDYSDRDTIEEIIPDVDVIFHLACRNLRHSLGNPRENHDVNATATLELLRSARRHRVRRFLYISTSEVYGTAQEVPMTESHPCMPETVYGASKLAGEAYARAFYRTYGFPTVVIRPFNNFGPRSHFEGDSGEVIPRFLVWALNGRAPIFFGDGNQTRDFIYVEETARWLRRAAECDSALGATINLGSGVETSVRQLAEIIYQEVTGNVPKPQVHPERPGDVRRLCAGVECARELLGFQVSIEIRDGIKRLIESWKARDADELLQMIPNTNWEELEG